MMESTLETLSMLASVMAFPTFGLITSRGDREIQELSNNKSIQGESSREEGDFNGTYLIIFIGVFVLPASDSYSDSRSIVACSNKLTHVIGQDYIPMI